MKLKKLESKALKTLEEPVDKTNKNKVVRLDTAVAIINTILAEKENKKQKKEDKVGY